MSDVLYPVDHAGMNPRTSSFLRNGAKGKIEVVIPLHYLRGLSDRCHDNIKLSMSYEFMGEYATVVHEVKVMLCNRDYETPVNTVDLIADETVVNAITDALKYFVYFRKHAQTKKTHPVHFEAYILHGDTR